MYNSMSALPSIPYNILTYLAKSDNEDLWKLLAYSDYDALSKPNLTFKQKMNLIWRKGPQDKFNIFFTPLVEDAIINSKPILKIYQYYIHANQLYTATVVYAFDFLYGGKMSMVEFDGVPVSRGDLLVNYLLTELNGAEVGGVGKLMFFDDLSRYCLAKSTIGNSKTFTGECLYMAVNIGDSGKVISCEN